MFSNHVTNDLSAYCNGELPSERSKEVAEHVISCTKCRVNLEEIKLGVKFAEQLPQLSAAENMWVELQSRIDRHETPKVAAVRLWRPRYVAIAAVMLIAIAAGILWLFRTRPVLYSGPSWQVATLNGRPRIGDTSIGDRGRLGVGQWLSTDNNSRAEIAVATIGQVQIDPNTRVRLVQTQPTEHRLELAKGRMSARIWAPPRLFFVDTPSAVAADIGCAYTLEVDDAGGSLLRVTSGWVALELKDRESMVPAGAACHTRPGIGPGTPYFEDASLEFRQALNEIDFGNDPSNTPTQLQVLLKQARVKDTLTLWNLLPRVQGSDRVRVYDKMVSLVPPPDGVTREGVLQLNQDMLNTWRNRLEMDWTDPMVFPKQVAEAYWKVKNGITRRVQKIKGK